MKALTIQELNKLLETTTDARLRTMILLGFRHGMRASEICGLRRADLDLAAGKIKIVRLKGSLTTVQPLGDDEKQSLADILSKSVASPYVFCNAFGKPFDRRTFWRKFKAACLAAGIAPDKSHPHALKHCLGCVLAESNVSLPIIKAYLGHKSASSTFIYAEPRPETIQKIVRDVIGF